MGREPEIHEPVMQNEDRILEPSLEGKTGVEN